MNDARISPLADTGIPGLDEILRGGFPRHRVYLVQGDPGAGKTTLALQFLLRGVDCGESVLYVTLSETREEIHAVAQSHGWSLDRLHIHELSPDERQVSLESENTVFYPAEVELPERMRALLNEVEEIRPARVVIDSLSELRLLAQDALHYRRRILALKRYFSGRQCTVLMLDDRVHSDPDQPPHTLAHGVLSLEQLSPEYGPDRRRLKVLKLRGVDFRSGFHDFRIAKGGLRVFPRLVAANHRGPIETGSVASGIAELDRLLGGGLDRASSTLLLGPSGSGKSTFTAQFAQAAARRGERSAFFLFDEGRDSFLRRATTLQMDFAKHVEAGTIAIRQIDPAELSPDEFVHAVRQAVESGGARLVVIDSLNGYLSAMPGERYLKIQMHELLSYLNQRGVTTFLVMAQYGLVGEMQSPLDLSYLSDTVLLLRFFESGGMVRKAVSVMKKRRGAHERAIREFSLGPGGVRVGNALEGFQGVLSGVPWHRGNGQTAMPAEGG